MRFPLAVCLLALSFTACGEDSSSEPKNNFVIVDGEDASIQKAIADARASVDYFITELKQPKAGHLYAVKKAFTQGDEVEHMWINDVSYEGTSFTGVINNQPQIVTDVKMGERASVDRSEISDWMITEPNGMMHGAYTVRALLPTLSGNQRESFEAMLAPPPKLD